MCATSTEAEMERLRQEVGELQRQLNAVQRIAEGLSSLTQLDDTIREALNLCLELAEAEAGSLVLFDPETRKLVYQYVIGEAAEEITGMKLDPDRGIAGQVFTTSESLITEDVSKVESHLHEVDERTGYVTQNMVTVPLKSITGEPIGVLQVLNKRVGAFGNNDVQLIQIMASEIAVGVESSRLAEEARLAEVVKFIGNISHDVKNMISPVQTGAETMLMFAEEAFADLDRVGEEADKEVGPKIAEAIATIRELLPEIVTMMLEGSDAVQQRMAEIAAAVKGIVSEPHFEEAEVAEIAGRVANLLKAHASKKNLTLEVEATDGCPPATVDKKQIYNAIYNLIYNAIDACEEGDRITFRVVCGPEAAWPEGNYIVLECEDTGPGMPPEVKARAFTKDAISTKPMGTGLGTKIIANVVEVHAGTIEVESEVGEGTTIRCKMPLYQPPR